MFFEISISDEFKARVYTRAEELHAQGITQSRVEDEPFGDLMVYIDNKPVLLMFSATGEEGALAGRTIYVGGEEA